MGRKGTDGRKRDRKAERAAGPLRTCRGCGRRRAQSELVRFVRPAGDGPIVGRKLTGRGFYVCPAVGCVEGLEKRLGKWMTRDEAARAMAALRGMLEDGPPRETGSPR